MSAAVARRRGPKDDPREFLRIRVGDLVMDESIQREVDPEKVARIAHEFCWDRFEALTVAEVSPGVYRVVEGQHRTGGALQYGGPDLLVPCMVITIDGAAEQSQVALDIVQGRRGHSAYEQWRLRYNSGHQHEVLATYAMEQRGVRVGKTASSMTIGAVATVRTIVHGGGHSPEYGGHLLGDTLDVIMAAYPTYDPESTVSRWDRGLLLAVSKGLHRFPEIDRLRFTDSFRIKPAIQWVNLGKRAEGPRPEDAILASVIEIYNRNRKQRNRIKLDPS